jgi:hypothetical protein
MRVFCHGWFRIGVVCFARSHTREIKKRMNQNGKAFSVNVCGKSVKKFGTDPFTRRLPIQVSVMRLACFACFILLAILSANAEEPVEIIEFKRYLSSPQRLGHIDFSVRIAGAAEDENYVGAINSSDFYIRRYLSTENPELLLSPTNMPRFSFFYGSTSNKCWEISGLNVHETEDMHDPGVQGSKNAFAVLQKGLCFGIPDVVAGSFKWASNSAVAKRAGEVAGEVVQTTTSKDGVVERIVLDPHHIPCDLYCSNNLPYKITSFGSDIYFDFEDSNLPEGIPSRATVSQRGTSKAQWTRIITIKKYGIYTEFPDGYFEPYRHITPSFLGIVKHARGEDLVVKDNNPAIAATYTKTLRANAPHRRWVVIGVIFAGAVLLGASVLRRRQR